MLASNKAYLLLFLERQPCVKDQMLLEMQNFDFAHCHFCLNFAQIQPNLSKKVLLRHAAASSVPTALVITQISTLSYIIILLFSRLFEVYVCIYSVLSMGYLLKFPEVDESFSLSVSYFY